VRNASCFALRQAVSYRKPVSDLAAASPPEVSVVIPVYDGAATIGPLVDDLIGRLRDHRLEVVLVNDASRDASEEACLALVARYPDVVVYAALARNFGEHNAVITGLRLATGQLVVTMDDDLQNPPSEVPRLLEEARRGCDVVYAQFETKRHHWFRNLGSRFNDAVANRLLGKPAELYLSTFRCMSRFLVDEILQYRGPYPYIDGLILRATSRIGAVTVRHDLRPVGKSGYDLRKLVAVWLNMSTSFSVLPLRVVVAIGVLLALAGACFGVEVVIEKIFWPQITVGWASLMTALIVFSGIQLIVLGTIGEYVGRLLLTVNRTPQGVIRRVVRGKDLVIMRAAAPRERASGA
jgi:glycosyltransferase involved in cell wall biosynthesis